MKKILLSILFVLLISAFLNSSMAESSFKHELQVSKKDQFKKIDILMTEFFKSTNDELREKKRNELLYNKENSKILSNSDEYANIIEKHESKLKENGFEIYKVTKNNYNQLQNELKMDFDSLFDSNDKNAKIPDGFTICIPDSIQSNSLEKSVLSKSDSYLPRFIWIYAYDDPAMAKTKTKNIYNKYSCYPYNDTLKEIINRSFNIYVGATTNYSWKILTALGIDMNSIGSAANESYYITLNANWTRKVCQVYSEHDGLYMNAASSDYVHWDTYEVVNYYCKSSNRMKREVNEENKTKYGRYYNDNDYLIAKAKKHIYSNPWRDKTGPVDADYDGTVEITLRDNF